MAISKTSSTLKAASSSIAANTADNATEWNLSSLFSGIAVGKITNGSSAPTTAPVIVFYAGESSGTKREVWRMSGDTVNSSVTPIVFRASKEWKYINVTATGGATNGSTWELVGMEFTGP